MTRKKPERPKCPDVFSVEFGRKLVAYLGGDPAPIKNSWCWSEFFVEYPDLQKGAEQYFASATEGDPAQAASWMACYWRSPRKWAERIIESAETGDPAWSAYRMALHGGSSLKWAKRVIETTTVGDPTEAARMMWLDFDVPYEWAQQVGDRQAERKRLKEGRYATITLFVLHRGKTHAVLIGSRVGSDGRQYWQPACCRWLRWNDDKGYVKLGTVEDVTCKQCRRLLSSQETRRAEA